MTVSGVRQRNIDVVLRIVRTYPGLPASMIAREAEMDTVEVRRRLSDAHSSGLVERGELVRVDGERAQVAWYPVGGTDVQARMFA